jgi:purine-nucleoside phosphorylase
MDMDRSRMSGYLGEIREAAEELKKRLADRFGDWTPDIGLVLGSGLGELGDRVDDPLYVGYEQIPHFPRSTVAGHAGRFVFGELEGKRVAVMQGRFHYYEGYPMRRVVFPVYVMRELGIRTLVLTNAAGGLNPSFAAGDLMLIADHINLTGDNPLIGPNDEALGPRFPDMSAVYDPELRALARRLAADIDGLRLVEGVYCGITGPSYSPPAELRMLQVIGGDAIGMSTVPEAIAARHAGLKVLGISCITDMALPDSLEPLTHEQVVAVAERTKPKFIELVRSILRHMAA